MRVSMGPWLLTEQYMAKTRTGEVYVRLNMLSLETMTNFRWEDDVIGADKLSLPE
jgi:hypothetical protein